MVSKKYDPLQQYLEVQSSPQISLSFAAIERILGAKLPASARKHRPWWSNNEGNSVMTTAWLGAGYRSEQVDMEGQRLVFRRQQTPGGGNGNTIGEGRSFYGCMKGMITVAEGYDLTDPADPDWHHQSERP